MKPLRTLTEIRAAACSKSLRERAQVYFTACEKIDKMVARLRYPSERAAVVLEHFGVRQLNEIPDPDRHIAEDVCAHDAGRVIHFAEYYLRGRINQLGADQLVSELNEGFRKELERELENLTGQLRGIFANYGVESELTAGNVNRWGEIEGNPCPPLRVLRGLLERAGPCPPGQGPNAIASAFRDVL
jgi:hypothetical protein